VLSGLSLQAASNNNEEQTAPVIIFFMVISLLLSKEYGYKMVNALILKGYRAFY
jgi:hypothetical protein